MPTSHPLLPMLGRKILPLAIACWRVDTDSAGRRVIAHSGGSVGANAFLVLYPEQRVVVAILSNTTARFVGGGTGGRQIAALFMPR